MSASFILHLNLQKTLAEILNTSCTLPRPSNTDNNVYFQKTREIPIRKVTYLGKDEDGFTMTQKHGDRREVRAWKHLQYLLWFSKLEVASLLLNWLFYKHILNRTIWLRPGIPHPAIMKTSQGEDLENSYRRNFITPTSAAEWFRGLSSVTNCIYHYI